jgi:hypothetical protein
MLFFAHQVEQLSHEQPTLVNFNRCVCDRKLTSNSRASISVLVKHRNIHKVNSIPIHGLIINLKKFYVTTTIGLEETLEILTSHVFNAHQEVVSKLKT